MKILMTNNSGAEISVLPSKVEELEARGWFVQTTPDVIPVNLVKAEKPVDLVKPAPAKEPVKRAPRKAPAKKAAQKAVAAK